MASVDLASCTHLQLRAIAYNKRISLEGSQQDLRVRLQGLPDLPTRADLNQMVQAFENRPIVAGRDRARRPNRGRRPDQKQPSNDEDDHGGREGKLPAGAGGDSDDGVDPDYEDDGASNSESDDDEGDDEGVADPDEENDDVPLDIDAPVETRAGTLKRARGRATNPERPQKRGRHILKQRGHDDAEWPRELFATPARSSATVSSSSSPLARPAGGFGPPIAPSSPGVAAPALPPLSDKKKLARLRSRIKAAHPEASHLSNDVLNNVAQGLFVPMRQFIETDPFLSLQPRPRTVHARIAAGLTITSLDDEKKIEDHATWLSAFDNWVKLTLVIAPAREPDLTKYRQRISRMAVGDLEASLLYDHALRSHRQGHQQLLEPFDPYIYSLASSHASRGRQPYGTNASASAAARPGSGNPTQPGSQWPAQADRPKSKDACIRWNRGTCNRGDKCLYTHKCSNCGLDHRASRCPRATCGQPPDQRESAGGSPQSVAPTGRRRADRAPPAAPAPVGTPGANRA